MGKFHFLEAAKICAVPKTGSIKSPGCLESLEVYRTNMGTALGGATLPAFAIWMGMEWTRAGTMAAHQIVGAGASAPRTQGEANQIGALAETYMRLAMPTSRDEQLAHLVAKTEIFERFSSQAGPYAEEVVQNLLRGIVVQSWTAFEALTEGLYECAGHEAKSALPRPLDKKGNPMKPGFRSRTKIKEAYAAAFHVDGDKIKRPLDDPSISALSLLRNVIVHRAAKADAEFLLWAAKTPLLLRYAGLAEKDSIVLNGKIVRSIVSPVIQNSYALVCAVGNWLRHH